MFGSSMGGLGAGQPSLSETVVNNYYNDPSSTGYDTSQNVDPGITQADFADNQDYSSDSGQDFGSDDGGSFDV